MAENSKIAWTTHTFNPWIGCTKVSDGCAHCYAENLMDSRYRKVRWGPQGTRVRTSEANWAKVFKWNRDAAGAADRPRVFCASLADILEDWPGTIHISGKSEDGKAELHVLWHGPTRSVTHGENYLGPSRCVRAGQMLMNPFFKLQPIGGYRHATMDDLRAELWDVIRSCTNLDFLLLTKRAERTHLVPTLPNIWMGVSIEDGENDHRWRNYLQHDKRFAVRWISCEPMLGRLPIENWATVPDWIVFGGESDQGAPARTCNIAWVREGLRACRERGIVPFVKQLGSRPVDVGTGLDWPEGVGMRHDPEYGNGARVILNDKAGAEPAEWPEDIRVREFPKIETAVSA